VRFDTMETVKKQFDQAGVGIPFPQRDVHLYIANGGDKLHGMVGTTAPAAAAKSTDGGLDG
jgi:small-conductance mechanosensitive channel